MSGILASHWGNDAFDRPALDFDRWVTGVLFHDWHYGVLDNLPILEASETAWVALTRRAVVEHFDDPVVDIVAKLQVRRLLNGQESEERAALIRQIDAHVDARLPESGYPLADFQWADRITRLCDNIAFEFAFGNIGTEQAAVHARQADAAETAIHYTIQTGGQILVQPWPFAVPSISGFITGFAADGYPDVLKPQMIQFTFSSLPA